METGLQFPRQSCAIESSTGLHTHTLVPTKIPRWPEGLSVQPLDPSDVGVSGIKIRKIEADAHLQGKARLDGHRYFALIVSSAIKTSFEGPCIFSTRSSSRTLSGWLSPRTICSIKPELEMSKFYIYSFLFHSSKYLPFHDTEITIQMNPVIYTMFPHYTFRTKKQKTGSNSVCDGMCADYCDH